MPPSHSRRRAGSAGSALRVSQFGEGPQRGGVPGAGGRRAGASMEGAAAGQGPAGLETPEGVAAGAAPEEWRDWAGGLPAGLLGKVAGKVAAQRQTRGLTTARGGGTRLNDEGGTGPAPARHILSFFECGGRGAQSARRATHPAHHRPQRHLPHRPALAGEGDPAAAAYHRSGGGCQARLGGGARAAFAASGVLRESSRPSGPWDPWDLAPPPTHPHSSPWYWEDISDIHIGHPYRI